jgi:NADH:ubiquinone reductase (H+-translocating)
MMAMLARPKRIVVLGGGFAGLWSAVGAARTLDELGVRPDAVEITLVNRDAYHVIRVRNYEPDLHEVRIALDDVLAPIDVRRVEGEVAGLDLAGRAVTVRTRAGSRTLSYDRLVLALGSELARPDIPGMAQHTFDVDTYGAGVRLNDHLRSLASRMPSPARDTVLVVGAGLTGIEAATEMEGKLRTALGRNAPFRVILADHSPRVGSDMGDDARPVIQTALAALGVETRTGVSVASVTETGALLDSGELIPAATVVWCAGLRATPLTRLFPAQRDRQGRVPVDAYLRVAGVEGVFAAGDAARAMMDDTHASVMSCQHGRPMGRFAGHNVVADLLGRPLLPLRIDWYVTCLDLGAWGAVYTEGWDRRVIVQGEAAKRIKREINCHRIYPPRSRDRREILAAAAPVVQIPPLPHH